MPAAVEAAVAAAVLVATAAVAAVAAEEADEEDPPAVAIGLTTSKATSSAPTGGAPPPDDDMAGFPEEEATATFTCAAGALAPSVDTPGKETRGPAFRAAVDTSPSASPLSILCARAGGEKRRRRTRTGSEKGLRTAGCRDHAGRRGGEGGAGKVGERANVFPLHHPNATPQMSLRLFGGTRTRAWP